MYLLACQLPIHLSIGDKIYVKYFGTGDFAILSERLQQLQSMYISMFTRCVYHVSQGMYLCIQASTRFSSVDVFFFFRSDFHPVTPKWRNMLLTLSFPFSLFHYTHTHLHTNSLTEPCWGIHGLRLTKHNPAAAESPERNYQSTAPSRWTNSMEPQIWANTFVTVERHVSGGQHCEAGSWENSHSCSRGGNKTVVKYLARSYSVCWVNMSSSVFDWPGRILR